MQCNAMQCKGKEAEILVPVPSLTKLVQGIEAGGDGTYRRPGRAMPYITEMVPEMTATLHEFSDLAKLLLLGHQSLG